MDQKVMDALSYGLFILAARQGERDNGCIINTAIQVTVEPCRIAVAVSKDNLTHDMVEETGRFTLSVLSEEGEFSLYQRFGYQSGREADKFAGLEGATARDSGGVPYVTRGTGAWLSCRVAETVDLGSHTLFVAAVDEGGLLSPASSATYAYYQHHIKPGVPPAAGKRQWVCRVCGYVYDGAELPAGFICPVCKHPAADFELLT